MNKTMSSEMSKKDKATMLNNVVAGKDSGVYNEILREKESAKTSLKLKAYSDRMMLFLLSCKKKERLQNPLTKQEYEIFDYLTKWEEKCNDVEDFRKLYAQVEEKYEDYFKH